MDRSPNNFMTKICDEFEFGTNEATCLTKRVLEYEIISVSTTKSSEKLITLQNLTCTKKFEHL